MNPLMSAMGAKSAPQNNVLQILQMLKSGNPEQIGKQMMQSNPEFARFMQSVRGKTPEQVAKEHGIDLSQIIKQFK